MRRAPELPIELGQLCTGGRQRPIAEPSAMKCACTRMRWRADERPNAPLGPCDDLDRRGKPPPRRQTQAWLLKVGCAAPLASAVPPRHLQHRPPAPYKPPRAARAQRAQAAAGRELPPRRVPAPPLSDDGQP